MAYCRQCGNETAAGEAFCRKCGARLSTTAGGTAAASTVSAQDEDLALFIGKNADKYLGKFGSFTQNGADSFAVTWHWPAFLFGVFWMLYRKLYLWALGLFLFVLTIGRIIPGIGLLASIASGVCANYIYYLHAQKKLREVSVRMPSPGPQRTAELARVGGTLSILLVLVPIGAVAVLGILAAIAIPQFTLYRQRAFDMKARLQVQDACSRGQQLFVADPNRAQVEPDDLLYAGLVRTADVDMMLLDGRRATFSLSSRHVQGSKLYVTDRECRLSEEQQKKAP